MNKKILIAGQGIAGAVLANTLRTAGADVYIADNRQYVSSSVHAAGVINPVTGKRYAKSWGFGTFFPFAKQFYTRFEQESGRQTWFHYPIIRLLGSPLESNEWNLRAARPEFAGLMDVSVDARDWEGLIEPYVTCGILYPAGRVDFNHIIQFTRTTFTNEARYLDQVIDPHQIAPWSEQFDYIIFCEGHRGEINPYFPGIPWQNAKGERLIIALNDEREIRYMLKKQLMVVPVGKNQYWVGANYYWEFEDSNPTLSGGKLLTDELDTLLTCGYQVLEHTAAIRPVIKDRRPVMGWSTLDHRVGIFNGTGSKGALLAPYWADHFTRHILEQSPLDPEVDIRRFAPPQPNG